VDLPLCLDSSNATALKAAVKEVNKPPIINSISGENAIQEAVLPLASEHGCQVIALAMDEKGIPKTVEARLAVITRVMEKTREAGVDDNDVYIDPLVTALATGTDSGLTAFETMKTTHRLFPKVHFTMGLSNISFGLPERTIINRIFLTLAMAHGLDAPIMDPMDKDLMATLLTASLTLGQDPHCMNYIRAYRAGRIGVKKP